MGDVKLFRINGDGAKELVGQPVKLEKKLQSMIEKHLETFLHVRFIKSEHPTGNIHSGRIDTLGIDENNCPTIIEYKRNSNVNVVNQGLFYLDWLMDHKADFELLVQKKFGQEVAGQLDWSAPRLLCIAEDFIKYDIHAIQQINRNIELIRYTLFENDLLLLDLVNVVSQAADDVDSQQREYTSQEGHLAKASPQLKDLYETVRDHMVDLGDDVQERFLKYYIAYKRMKNFATIQLQTGKNGLLMWLPVNPDSIKLEDGFSRDVRGKGHHGTGDLELTVRNFDDFEKAKPIILKSFEEN